MCERNNFCATGAVSVFLGDGNGSFQPAVTYSSGGYWALSVSIGDVNGDGKSDIGVTNWCPTDCF